MTTPNAELILPSGHVALVDAEDLAAVVAAGPWYANRPRHIWYVHRRLAYSRWQYLHKFLTGYAMTDHANGDGLDNRRANLRPANTSLNNANRIRVHGKSGFRGVDRRPSGRWRASIQRDGRTIYLGTFDTPEEAAYAYDAVAVELFGEFARPNFPTVRADA